MIIVRCGTPLFVFSYHTNCDIEWKTLPTTMRRWVICATIPLRMQQVNCLARYVVGVFGLSPVKLLGCIGGEVV